MESNNNVDKYSKSYEDLVLQHKLEVYREVVKMQVQ